MASESKVCVCMCAEYICIVVEIYNSMHMAKLEVYI